MTKILQQVVQKKVSKKNKKSNIAHNTPSLELYYHMKVQRRDLKKKNKRFHYLHVPMILDLVGTVGSAEIGRAHV